MNAPVPLPLTAYGKAIKDLDHGLHHTIARADSRGRYVPGHDEKVAAYIVHAANMYPKLESSLRGILAAMARASWVDTLELKGAIICAEALLKECEA